MTGTTSTPREAGYPSLFDRTRFQGTLSGHGSSLPIGFYVRVDHLGVLQLELDSVPYSQEAYALHVLGDPATPVDLIALEGTSEAGHVFRSNSFFIGEFSHNSKLGAELSYQGECHDAELELPSNPDRRAQSDTRVWRVRQFRTFQRIAHETPLGRVFIGGPMQDSQAQEPSGFMAIYRPEGDASSTWSAESERFLMHIARVLSFACDTYLRPMIEECWEKGRVTLRIRQQARASGPYMPPFDQLHMEPIFACACDSYFTRYDAVEQLDAAIRWLIAPVVYDESRLINAMSALENILDRCGLHEVDTFMGPSPFKGVAKEVRGLLAKLEVPAGMAGKVAELNRRPLAEKVATLLTARDIMVHDLPENWLEVIIRQRNTIVHTGVSGDFDEHDRAFDHTIWAREIVTRIILERLGFEGAYRSWLHRDKQLYFPACVRMQEWLRRQNTSAS